MNDTTNSAPMRVLFLCTHNSSRSQMTEGLLRARGGDRYTVFSAGTHPRNVHPLAIQVMREIGIDISEAAGHRAKSLDEFKDQQPMDLVVTVCDDAAEECPYFPGARRQEHGAFLIPARSLAAKRSDWPPSAPPVTPSPPAFRRSSSHVSKRHQNSSGRGAPLWGKV